MNYKCKEFSEWLTSNRINHNVHNKGYHIQVQGQHNFYPSTGKYYNSESSANMKYPKFESGNAFLQFLGEQSK